jgi:hypothetical protein
LATSLFDACHEDVKTKVAKGMIGATSCLINDGWSNVNNDAIVNYMVMSPEFALFLESVSTCQQGHDHKFITNDIERVIREHPSTIFAGAIIDNTSTNKKVWGLLQITFSSRYFQGCCSHGLHLFIKDVFAATKTKKVGQVEATYPDNTRSSSCWNLLPTARMSSSTFTTITSPRLTYEICSSLSDALLSHGVKPT